MRVSIWQIIHLLKTIISTNHIDSKNLVDIVGDFDKDYPDFSSIGTDLISHIPVDYLEDKFKYHDIPERYEKMLNYLNKTWLDLSKKSKEDVKSSLIPTDIPFFIPGDRFREFYYWDSLWILKGLLKSDMVQSAENIIRNMIYMINKYGFIPNGSRSYYLNRSQPPVFCQMLDIFLKYDLERNKELVLGEGLDAALKEYEWFMINRSLIKRNGSEWSRLVSSEMNYDPKELSNFIILNQYHAVSDKPRDESKMEDEKVLNDLLEVKDILYADEEEILKYKKNLYTNICSSAESGWDFSTRFMEDSENLHSLNIIDTIPVDLNVLMYKNELILSELLELNSDERSTIFKQKSEEREKLINLIFWNNEKEIWNDYNYKTSKHKDDNFYFSNIMPLLYQVKSPIHPLRIIKRYFKILFKDHGVPASLKKVSKQQWDFPNAWAPHQSMLVDYLKKDYQFLAVHAARSFLDNALNGFENEGVIFEKYNVKNKGITGSGGEYKPQIGFGWSNGVLIEFILDFRKELMEMLNHEDSYSRIKNLFEELYLFRKKKKDENLLFKSHSLV